MMQTLSTHLNRLAALVALLVLAPLALATDVVVLKDGRTVEGDIIREIDGNIWMIVYFGEIQKQEFFSAASIESITRDANVDVADREEEDEADAPRPGVKRGAVITLEGMVGVEFAAIMQTFGCKVVLVEMLPHILPLEDPDCAETAECAFQSGDRGRLSSISTGCLQRPRRP